MKGLKEKMVVITGGGRGIGYAIAKKFAAEQSHLILADLNAEVTEHAVEELRETGAKASAYQLDVSHVDEVDTFFETLVREHGVPDILVNNAGIQIRSPSIDFAEQDWDKLMGVNLKAAFFCSQAFARHVQGRGGAIVNISSGTSTQTTPGRAPYVISKAGINAMTAVLASEWAAKKIRVNAVAPGWILTDMVQDGLRLGVINHRMLMSAIPFRRFADPSEIADSVAYLASEEASYVTGQTLFVDGGWSSLGLPQEVE